MSLQKLQIVQKETLGLKQLGQRDYWRIQQITKQLGASVEDLIHAAGRQQIQLCINVFGFAQEMNAHRIPMPDESLSERDLSLGWADEPSHGDILAERMSFWHRTTSPMAEGIYELYFDDARRLELSVSDSIFIKDAVRFDGKDWWIVEFSEVVKVNATQLVIRHEELQKFQSLTPSANQDPRGGIADQILIGMLVLMLRMRQGQKLSEAAVMEQLLSLEMRLRPDGNSSAIYGLSLRSLQEKFKQARDALETKGVPVKQLLEDAKTLKV